MSLSFVPQATKPPSPSRGNSREGGRRPAQGHSIHLCRRCKTIRIFRPQQQATAKGQVTGVVKDSRGEGIIGASVRIKGTKLGAQTGIDGAFTINTDKASGELQISYVGYYDNSATFTAGQPVTVV